MSNNVNPCQPDKLVQALVESGLEAHQFKTEEKSIYVVVPILDMGAENPIVKAQSPEVTGYLGQAAESWDYEAYLYIAASGESEPCKVGVLGRYGETGELYRSDEWMEVSSTDEAVAAFWKLWDQRDSLVSVFTGRGAETA